MLYPVNSNSDFPGIATGFRLVLKIADQYHSF